MHPFCRSTTLADFGEGTLKGLQRRARDKDGKVMKVPADLTYGEWAENISDNNDGSLKLAFDIIESNNSPILTGSENYAKWDGLFTIYPPIKGDAITEIKLFNTLNKNDIGRKTIEYLKTNDITVEINYTDEVEPTLYGTILGKHICVYAHNTKSVLETAATIVHEATHAKYGIGGNQWAEAQCFAAEEIFKTGKPLTFEQKKSIIKNVKKSYPYFEWRRKQ